MSLAVPEIGPVIGLRVDAREMSVRKVPGVMGVGVEGRVVVREPEGIPRGG